MTVVDVWSIYAVRGVRICCMTGTFHCRLPSIRRVCADVVVIDFSRRLLRCLVLTAAWFSGNVVGHISEVCPMSSWISAEIDGRLRLYRLSD